MLFVEHRLYRRFFCEECADDADGISLWGQARAGHDRSRIIKPVPGICQCDSEKIKKERLAEI